MRKKGAQKTLLFFILPYKDLQDFLKENGA